MVRLLLVRHGITEFNSTGRFAGYSDVEMSATGYKQAESLRERLAEEKIDFVYSSDLRRALATAEIISSGRKIDIIPCPELREVNYGNAEGRTFKEISQLYPEVAELITNFNLRLDFPGGESFKAFIERASTFIDRLKNHKPTETMLIVSHSGPIRVLVCRLMGIGLKHWGQIGCDNASLSIVETYSRGVRIRLLNGTSHLKTMTGD